MQDINTDKIKKLLPSKTNKDKKPSKKPSKKTLKDLDIKTNDKNKQLKKTIEKRKEIQLSKENKIALKEALRNFNKRNMIRNEINKNKKPTIENKSITQVTKDKLSNESPKFRALVDMKHHDMLREANELQQKYIKKAIIDEMNKDNELMYNQPKLIAKIRGRY